MNLSVNLDICRVCMKSNKQYQQLLEDTSLSKRWIFTTQLPLDKSDNLPKQLCEKCILRLKLAYDFVSLAQKSDKNLRDFLVKIRNDFQQVTSTSVNAKTTEDEDEDDGDNVAAAAAMHNNESADLLALLEGDSHEQQQLTKSNTKTLSHAAAATTTTTATTAAKVSKYRKKLPPLQHELGTTSTTEFSLATDVLTKNVKHERQDFDDYVEEQQDFVLADTENAAGIGDDDEDFQLFDVNFSDHVETLENIDVNMSQAETTLAESVTQDDSSSQMALFAQADNEEECNIDEAEMHDQQVLEVDVVQQLGTGNNNEPDNDGDGFLKEYEGSITDDDEQVRIDYIEVASTEEMLQYETVEMQTETRQKQATRPKDNEPQLETLEITALNYKLPKKSASNRSNTASKIRASIPASTRFICTKCNRDFSTKTNLTRHMATHEGSRPYKCDVCGKAFTQNGSLKQHMFTHTGVKPFVCVFCNRGFTQSKSLIFHLRRHTGHKPFHCDFCGLDFRQKDGLKTHILRHHMEQRVGSEVNMCIICKKSMNSKQQLQAHMQQHVNNHKSLDTEGDTQTGEQNAAVILELMGEDELIIEKATFNDELSVNLPSINSSTHVFDVIATSAAEPSRAKKYQCRRCFKCFAIKRNLIRHLGTHDMSPSELFQCETCQIAFDTNYALKLHRVREHKETGINLNECEECQMSFDSLIDLNMHMEQTHQYTCSECPELSFKTQKLLMDHMLEHELDDNEDELKNQRYYKKDDLKLE